MADGPVVPIAGTLPAAREDACAMLMDIYDGVTTQRILAGPVVDMASTSNGAYLVVCYCDNDFPLRVYQVRACRPTLYVKFSAGALAAAGIVLPSDPTPTPVIVLDQRVQTCDYEQPAPAHAAVQTVFAKGTHVLPVYCVCGDVVRVLYVPIVAAPDTCYVGVAYAAPGLRSMCAKDGVVVDVCDEALTIDRTTTVCALAPRDPAYYRQFCGRRVRVGELVAHGETADSLDPRKVFKLKTAPVHVARFNDLVAIACADGKGIQVFQMCSYWQAYNLTTPSDTVRLALMGGKFVSLTSAGAVFVGSSVVPLGLGGVTAISCVGSGAEDNLVYVATCHGVFIACVAK